MKAHLLLYLTLAAICCSCYTFRGTSIPSDVNTFYVDQAILRATNAPGDLPERLMEALRAKIRNQSSLQYSDQSPDIEFGMEISSFVQANEVESAENNTAALLKLTISVRTEYISNRNEEDNWNQTFSHTVNYDPSVDFQTAQDGLIAEVFEQITEQIFNKAFANW